MPDITTPDGTTWKIRPSSEVTERQSRELTRTYMPSFLVAKRLVDSGFDEKDPETWEGYTSLSAEEQTAFGDYQAALIVAMVEGFTGDPLDLPKNVFEPLAGACSDEYNGASVNTEADIAPLVPTSDSPS